MTDLRIAYWRTVMRAALWLQSVARRARDHADERLYDAIQKGGE